MDAVEAVVSRLGQRRTQSFTGVFRGMDGAYAIVDAIDAIGVRMASAAQLPPVAGDVVQVEMRNGALVMLGPVKPHPTRGTVLAEGSPLITVQTTDGELRLPYMSAYTPAVNDDVAIEWTGEGGLVKGRVSTTPVPEPVVPPTPTEQAFHPSPFLASEAGYHRLSNGAFIGTWFPNYGTGQASAAWYGSVVADSIPDDAVITLARIYLSERQAQFGGPAIQAIAGIGAQGRAPVNAAIPLPARSGWVGIPFEIVDLLKVAGRGVSIIGATNPSGSSIYNKLSDDAMSFALDIAWRTP